MNRTALGVISLAVGAVLIIGLFNIYKPAINGMTHDVFDKIRIGEMENATAPSRNPPHKATRDKSLDNKPDSYEVTPNQWRHKVHVRVMTPNEADHEGHTVSSSVKFYHRYWSHSGNGSEPRLNKFDLPYVAEITNNHDLKRMHFVSQKDFASQCNGTYTTKYNSSNNILYVLMSQGW